MTGIPEQIGLAETEIETLTGINGLTVMMIEFDVAGFPVWQMTFEVKMQLTTSLLRGIYVNTGLLTPAGTPLTCHS